MHAHIASRTGIGRKAKAGWIGAGAALVLALAAGSGLAQDDTVTNMRAERGLEKATLWCAQCHSVEKEVTADTVTEAPGFYQIANKDGQTLTAVKLFLTQPVHPMPNLSLAREEIEDLATYIMSLREPPSGVSGG